MGFVDNFATDQAWEEEAASLAADIKATTTMLVIYWIQRKHFWIQSNAYLELSRRLEKVYVYAHMKNDQDTMWLNTKSLPIKGMSLYSLLGETFAFYEPEFMAITDEQYKAFVSEVPALEQYGHYFDRLLEKKNMSCLKRRGITCRSW